MSEPTMENIGRLILTALTRATKVRVDRPLARIGCKVSR